MSSLTRTAKLTLLSHICALAVGTFFLHAAYSKIGWENTRQFSVEVRNYRILSEPWVNIPAIIMPWWEVAAAVALMLPFSRRAGAILIAAMLLVFIAAVGYSSLYMGLDISCGCTGAHSSRAGWLTIGRNVLLLLGVFLSVYLHSPTASEPAGCPAVSDDSVPEPATE